uniref:Thioredoxin domain-containing protein n=1 Tax=Meloidogyne floridensis TaxID=298350 RepID=A0A915P0L8_9BILA
MRFFFSSFILLYFLFYFVIAKVEEKRPIKEKQSNSINEDENQKIEEKEVDLSNGFGTDIDWVQWNDAVSIALDLNKPIFLLIHKTWCGACQALKKSFASSNKREELIELSKQFVMVNVEDDDEPEEEEYAPDGRYIPRLFILNKEGHPLAVDNAKNYPKNKQYFPQVPDVIIAMKLGLKKLEGQEEEEDVVEEEKEVKKDEKVKEKELKEKAKKEENKKPASGGCPHAAGKAAKKAEEEAKKKKVVKDKNVETKKEADKKVKEKVKDGAKKEKEGAKKEKQKTTEKTKKSKEDKEKPKKTEKKKKEKEEL